MEKPLRGNVAEYHVENFGCRASRSDGEAIAAALRERGLEPAGPSGAAEVVIVNTCSVTAEADRQARAYVRRVRRQNPGARVIVTGCYAQRAPEELAGMAEVDAVVGNSHKSLVAEVAAELAQRGRRDIVPVSVLVDDAFAHTDLAALPFAAEARQTRPNLKVQDGCGNRCSFCIIPKTRGQSRSVGLEACLDNVRRFVERGGQELVVSGINLGRWGRDLEPGQRLEELAGGILRRTELPRLRLSSIEPMDWTDELLALYAEYGAGEHPRLARHAHLPLQSGSDRILRKMHRRYRPWHYAARVEKIRELMPEAGIGADVMAGFPGETEALFQESYDFIAAQPFTYLHLFPFSARPGTPGWEWQRESPVAAGAVRERMEALRRLAAEKAGAFREGLVGGTVSAVTVEPGEAVTDNFLKLALEEAVPANRMVRARVTGVQPEGITGSTEERGLQRPGEERAHLMTEALLY